MQGANHASGAVVSFGRWIANSVPSARWSGGAIVGSTLVDHPDVGGLTFTGSYQIGMNIVRKFAAGRWPRPCIAEMGGKNAMIIDNDADQPTLEARARAVWERLEALVRP